MKKVGIMTWYQHKNYGTILQAAALIHVIEKLGYRPFGIDYISEGYDRQTRLEKLLSIKRIKAGIKHVYEKKKYPPQKDQAKLERFDLFMDKYVSMTRASQTSSQLFQLNREFDAFVCGSDQIWTPFAYNAKYFLDFADGPQKKIAYAPSFGADQIQNESVREEIGKQLKQFSALSVREKQGAEMIQAYYGLQAEVVLDPTLLLDSEEWDAMCEPTEKHGKTLLCYVLGENESIWKKIKKIASQNSLEISVIPVHDKDYHRGFHVLEGVGPGQFLSEIKHADFVCTDSFHGSVFSVLNHIPFIVFKRFADQDPRSQNSRVLNLLSSLGLESHLWNGNPDFPSTDWTLVDQKLGELKKQSISFLANALEKATRTGEKASAHKVITNTCCGCGVCAKACPKQAIGMTMRHGFYQAVVDDALCVNCGLCDRVCAFNGETGRPLRDAALFEAKSRKMEVLQTSTSGGIAQELVLKALDEGVPVWGCIFDPADGLVKHRMQSAPDTKKASQYQGSKYLQSRFFDDGLSILDQDKGLMIGTPCQIAGADQYLRGVNKRDRFLLVDLICHGVPTKDLWAAYLRDEGLREDQVSEVLFRDPKMGWRNIYISVKSGRKEIHRKEAADPFYQFFDLQACYMPSCYECNFRTASKADIRLGDYWGKQYTQDDLKYGVSMAAAFTQAGTDLLNQLKNDEKIELKERPIEEYFKGQGPVNPIIPLYYPKLMEDLENQTDSLPHLLCKHCNTQYWNKRAQHLLSNIRKIGSKR